MALSLSWYLDCFFPIKEPWRNNIVEHFNNVFDKSFYRNQSFKSFLHLYSQAKVFEVYHNGNHSRYSSLSGKTPNESELLNPIELADNFTIPDLFPIYPGHILII